MTVSTHRLRSEVAAAAATTNKAATLVFTAMTGARPSATAKPI